MKESIITQIEQFLVLSFWLVQNLSLVLRRIPDKREWHLLGDYIIFKMLWFNNIFTKKSLNLGNK